MGTHILTLAKANLEKSRERRTRCRRWRGGAPQDGDAGDPAWWGHADAQGLRVGVSLAPHLTGAFLHELRCDITRPQQTPIPADSIEETFKLNEVFIPRLRLNVK